ncbi:glucosamine inositolphosphorylceramide transferase family protein [Alsobacter sp. R-9]
MHIQLRASRVRPWSFVGALASRLREAGHDVSVAWIDDGVAPPASGLLLLLELEAFIFGPRRPCGFEVADLPLSAADEPTRGPLDLVIDFSGSPVVLSDTEVRVVVTCDGVRFDDGLVGSLIDGAPPAIHIVDPATGEIVTGGLVAIDDFTVMRRALGQACDRMVTLCLMVVEGHREARGGEPHTGWPQRLKERAVSPVRLARHLSAELAGKVSARLRALVERDHHWFIGWRRRTGRSVWQSAALDVRSFLRLPDDRNRYFADPFPVDRGEDTIVFCEEYPYATGRGLISAFTIHPDGTTGPVRPIIETEHHLSYPLVIEAEGHIWMIPESADAGCVDIWRAVSFPDRWERHGTLIADRAIVDATLVNQGGRWWLFGSSRSAGSSFNDALEIWHSERLLGPWTPLQDVPVLVDASAARPAGHMRVVGGTIWRVAQDCRKTYGGGLAFCRVDVLDVERGFQQSVAHRLPPPPGLDGVHTLNETARIETIDMRGTRSRKPLLDRFVGRPD